MKRILEEPKPKFNTNSISNTNTNSISNTNTNPIPKVKQETINN